MKTTVSTSKKTDLIDAIEGRSKIRILYKSEGAEAPQVRVVRPLVYGVHNGVEKLFGSQETPTEHFGSYVLDKILLLTILDETFRPSLKESAEPKGWEKIYANVQPVRLVPRYTEEDETRLRKEDELRKMRKDPINEVVLTWTTEPKPTEITLADLHKELQTLNKTMAGIATLMKTKVSRNMM